MRKRDRPVAAGISRLWIYAPAAALLLAIGYATLGPAPAHETPGATLPTSVAPLAGDAAAHLRPPPSSPKPVSAAQGHHAAALRLAPGAAEMGLAAWSDVPAEQTADGENLGGETMGTGALTAAHPSLPIGSRALVENVKNGQTVVVRITGHGPLAAGHIIDLSKAAAARLDMVADGAATVRVRSIDDTRAGTKRHIDIW
jgi:rare lipoprotein A